MKSALSFLLIALTSLPSLASENQIKMNFRNEPLSKVVEHYSKTTGQKFIVDSTVTGSVSIFNPQPVPYEEAFHQLSSALALQGYGISKQGDTMIIKQARNIQRSWIEVGTTLPALRPERMFTWVYTVQNLPADTINRELRILSSRDGEMAVNVSNNQLIFTDWTSNLARIAEILKAVDIKPTPAATRFAETTKKEWETRKKKAAADADGKKPSLKSEN